MLVIDIFDKKRFFRFKFITIFKNTVNMTFKKSCLSTVPSSLLIFTSRLKDY